VEKLAVAAAALISLGANDIDAALTDGQATIRVSINRPEMIMLIIFTDILTDRRELLPLIGIRFSELFGRKATCVNRPALKLVVHLCKLRCGWEFGSKIREAGKGIPTLVSGAPQKSPVRHRKCTVHEATFGN